MALEIEIKLAVKDRKKLYDLINFCESESTRASKQIKQKDEYFDTPENLLREKDLTVRLRTVDDKIKVAIKSPRIYIDDKIHKRVEIELSVTDESEIRAQLKNHSLVQKTIIEKKRQVFWFDNTAVSIDELPFIGTFVEIEAHSSDRIRNILEIFHLSEDNAVRENYTELLEAHFSRIGLPTKTSLIATFEAENEFKEKDSKTC